MILLDLTAGHVGQTVTYSDDRLKVTGVLESLEARVDERIVNGLGQTTHAIRAVVIQIDDVVIATPDLTALITVHQETPHV